MTSPKSFWPYDYVRVDSSQVAVVRAMCDCGQHVVVRPTYRLGDGGKHKVAYEQSLPYSALFALEPGLRMVESSRLSLLRPWNGAAVHDSAYPSSIHTLLKILEHEGVELFRYGSRILPFPVVGDAGDWDFVVNGGEALSSALTRALADGVCRRLQDSELNTLVGRYSYYRRSLSTDDLHTLLDKCLSFVAAGDLLVDFFTVDLLSGPPLTVPHRFVGVESQVEGVLLPTRGSSYGMPRSFSLATESTVCEIKHLSWLLGGLELLAGQRVTCHNIGVAPHGEYWYSPWFSKLRLA